MKKIKLEKIELKRIESREFSLETEIQKMTVNVLGEIFNLDCIDPEFQFGPISHSGENRIDILAFDNESKSFVIIECKRKKTAGATEQGRRYINEMNAHKLEVYAKYQKLRKEDAIPLGDIKWSKSRVIVISPGHTKDQKGDDDSRIELWEVKKYENNTVSFSRVDKSAPEGDSEYMFEVTSGKGIEPVIPLTKGEQKHLAKRASKETKDLYERFRSSIPFLREIEIISQVKTINYFVAGSRIISIVIQQTQLKMWINMPELKVPKGEMRDVSKIRTWIRANYEKVITSDMSNEKLKYIFGLVEQSLRHHSGNKKETEKHKNPTKSLTKGRFTEEHHIKMGSEEIVALYKGLRRDIMALGDIKIKCNEQYMNLMANGVIIAYILIRKTKLKIKINMPEGKLKRCKKIMRDASKRRSWPPANYDKDIKSDISDEELGCIVGFVKQSLKYKGKKRRIRDDE